MADLVRVRQYERDNEVTVPPIETVPESTRIVRGFKSTLIYVVKGIPLRANIRLKRLSVEDYYEVPRVIMKDRDGRSVISKLVDAMTGLEIGVGTTGTKFHRLLVNTEGRTVPASEIRYFQVLSDGSEMEISRFESNIGAGKDLRVEAEIEESEAERYLYESVYEINGEKDIDDEVLFSIAQNLIQDKKALVVTVVFRKGFKKSWGLIFADVFNSSFSMTMRVSRTKLEALHPMRVPSAKFVKVEKVLPQVVWERKR